MVAECGTTAYCTFESHLGRNGAGTTVRAPTTKECVCCNTYPLTISLNVVICYCISMPRNSKHLIKFPWFYKYRIPRNFCPHNFLSVGRLQTRVTADGQGHHMRRKYQLCQGISEICLCLLPGSSHLWVPRENLRTSYSDTLTEHFDRILCRLNAVVFLHNCPSCLGLRICLVSFVSHENFSIHSVFVWGASQMIWFWLE